MMNFLELNELWKTLLCVGKTIGMDAWARLRRIRVPRFRPANGSPTVCHTNHQRISIMPIDHRPICRKVLSLSNWNSSSQAKELNLLLLAHLPGQGDFSSSHWQSRVAPDFYSKEIRFDTMVVVGTPSSSTAVGRSRIPYL